MALADAHDTHTPASARPRRGLRKGDQREAAIIETARRLLIDQPASSITIEQLAAGAGITRPAFYFYFDSRGAVMRAVVDDVTASLRPLVDAYISVPGPVPVRVRGLIEAYLRRWHEQGHVLRAMYALADSDPDFGVEWDATVTESIDLVAAFIRAEQRAGRALPAPPDADEIAAALVAMLWRTGHQLPAGKAWSEADDRLVDTMTTLCLRALYGTTDAVSLG